MNISHNQLGYIITITNIYHNNLNLNFNTATAW